MINEQDRNNAAKRILDSFIRECGFNAFVGLGERYSIASKRDWLIARRKLRETLHQRLGLEIRVVPKSADGENIIVMIREY